MKKSCTRSPNVDWLKVVSISGSLFVAHQPHKLGSRHECDLTQRIEMHNSEDDHSYTKATLVGDVQCYVIQKVLGVLWNPVGDCLVFE